MKSDDIDDDRLNDDRAAKRRNSAGGDGRPGN
jgi:hypothetical protein